MQCGPFTNVYQNPQCTCLAYAKRPDIYNAAVKVKHAVPAGGPRVVGSDRTDYSVWDGSQWLVNAGAAGIPTGNQPTPGSIVVFGTPNAADWGHVAYVEHVASPTWIAVDECNIDFRGTCRYDYWENPQARSEPLQGYIYGGPAGNGPVSGGSAPSATAIAASSNDSCAVLSTGRVDCWGGNLNGALGNGTTADGSTTPLVVSGLTTATAISDGNEDDACARLPTGRVDCWGYNGFGQLGDGTSTGPQRCGSFPCSTRPVVVVGLTNATAISAGTLHSCALLSTGRVDCWGENHYDQLGDGRTTDRSTPVAVSGLTHATAISAGGFHSCALLSTGGVDCWGDNEYGQLGDGRTTNSSTPVAVGITNATAISAGFDHSCALLSTGGVDCWGCDRYGQLGDGTTTDSSTPVAVSGLTNATAISAGGEHSCALLSTGRVDCWGENYFGELGNGTTTDSSTPVAVSGLTSATIIAAGNLHSCALLSTGGVDCWGENGSGQLGDGTLSTDRLTPVPVRGLK